MAVAVKFLAGNFIQVYEGHTLRSSHIGGPQGMWFTNNPAILAVGVTRSERHEYGVRSFLAYIIDIHTQVTTVAIDGILPLGALIESCNQRVGVHTRNHATGALFVEEVR